jgi:hypothetical protein
MKRFRHPAVLILLGSLLSLPLLFPLYSLRSHHRRAHHRSRSARYRPGRAVSRKLGVWRCTVS